MVQSMNSNNMKTFDKFTDQDWMDFVDEHIDEIMKNLDANEVHNPDSIQFNLEHNGYSKNDYLSFLNDNRRFLNKVIEVNDDNAA